jgi:hypothetical protein
VHINLEDESQFKLRTGKKKPGREIANDEYVTESRVLAVKSRQAAPNPQASLEPHFDARKVGNTSN